MAETATYIASVQVGDSAKKLGSASFIVAAADAQAYIAAADATARAATDVGVLLDAALGISRADALDGWKKWSIQADFLNTLFDYPVPDDGIYISNKWKVTFATTNAGIPAVDTVYVPAYLITGVVMSSDGISADLNDAPVSDFVTAFEATALSKYRTAVSAVLSIERNDS